MLSIFSWFCVRASLNWSLVGVGSLQHLQPPKAQQQATISKRDGIPAQSPIRKHLSLLFRKGIFLSRLLVVFVQFCFLFFFIVFFFTLDFFIFVYWFCRTWLTVRYALLFAFHFLRLKSKRHLLSHLHCLFFLLANLKKWNFYNFIDLTNLRKRNKKVGFQKLKSDPKQMQ